MRWYMGLGNDCYRAIRGRRVRGQGRRLLRRKILNAPDRRQAHMVACVGVRARNAIDEQESLRLRGLPPRQHGGPAGILKCLTAGYAFGRHVPLILRSQLTRVQPDRELGGPWTSKNVGAAGWR